jgi:hypothetical protein
MEGNIVIIEDGHKRQLPDPNINHIALIKVEGNDEPKKYAPFHHHAIRIGSLYCFVRKRDGFFIWQRDPLENVNFDTITILGQYYGDCMTMSEIFIDIGNEKNKLVPRNYWYTSETKVSLEEILNECSIQWSNQRLTELNSCLGISVINIVRVIKKPPKKESSCCIL